MTSISAKAECPKCREPLTRDSVVDVWTAGSKETPRLKEEHTCPGCGLSLVCEYWFTRTTVVEGVTSTGERLP